MRLVHSVALGALALGVGLTLAGQPDAPVQAAAAVPAVKQDPYPQKVLWGDTHLHTANSFDAFTAGLRLGPEDALRFARGEEVTTAGGKAKLHRPLDFLTIADHSDAIGVTADLYNTPEDQIADPTLKRWRAMMHQGGDAAYGAFREMVTAASKGTLPPDFADPKRMRETARRVWDGQLDAVERYNEPGKFTALIGFEYSLQPKGNTLHRNVIFRDGADKARKVLPFPSDGKKGPEPLWDYMDAYARATGGQTLAIPHNSNLSNGMAFLMSDWDGGQLTAEMNRRRAAHEPLAEVTQYKGDSESHPALSRNDEFADFGDAGWENGNAPLTTLKQPGMFGGEYLREVLKRGLLLEAETGINPYMLGLIGSSDSHTALASTEEDNFHGKFSNEAPGADRGNAVVNPGIKEGRIGWQYQSGGLAAVWATANTREAIFDAMQRREVYATTGPRMTVRVFAGWDFSPRDLKGDWVRTGYARGVPMGGAMKPGKGAPSLLISALKDPIGANLDRVQVIKGWVDAQGEPHEQIYDVAWSAPGRRKIVGGKLAPVGDTVNLATATYRNSIGAAALSTVWRDPDFHADQRAFYYVRVLEIPTPRWVAYDMVRFGTKPPKGARLKDQERAYTSPIWYRPQS
ncbi:DUF3604 domain-containing protein [Novosphingobium sp.]|uniref:DUF3604 domain-containing protein n=1 Tax=Novosphingobium sp. TaxID=1874826 RepID=UPI0025E5BAAA|nr:DUF3604 domain-containing protein [Novosphingobium sp.]MCC6925824.1 DUF3604 domain-containing protein [Novosphingobium sp.]